MPYKGHLSRRRSWARMIVILGPKLGVASWGPPVQHAAPSSLSNGRGACGWGLCGHPIRTDAAVKAGLPTMASHRSWWWNTWRGWRQGSGAEVCQAPCSGGWVVSAGCARVGCRQALTRGEADRGWHSVASPCHPLPTLYASAPQPTSCKCSAQTPGAESECMDGF